MRIALRESTLGLRNSTTRIPFRYGTANLTRCPQAILQVVVSCDGAERLGFSGDCLPPSWFDKSAEKDFATQIRDMLRVIAMAQWVYSEELRNEAPFFPAWFIAQDRVQLQCAAWGLPPLLAAFGSSLLERAILDAACRWANVSFATAVRSNGGPTLTALSPPVPNSQSGMRMNSGGWPRNSTDRGKDSSAGSTIAAIGARLAPEIARAF